MSAMVPDPHMQRRLYLTLAAGLDGKLSLTASHAQPKAGVCAILLNSRGMLAVDPVTILLVSMVPTPTPAFADLGTVTLTEKALVQISAGVRTVTLSLAGVAKGDQLLLSPIDALPAGYMVQATAIGSDAGKIKATVIAPLLAIGAAYSIPCRVRRFN